MKKTCMHALAGAFILSLSLASCSQKKSEDTQQTNSDTAAAATEQEPAKTEVNPQITDVSSAADDAATGIDVSHFNGAVKWGEIKAAGIDFAYSKATQGKSYIDPKFAVNEEGSGKVGLMHGAYHFYMAADDPKEQAQLFIDAMKKLDDGTLPPVLDLEQGGVSGKVDVKTFQANVLLWLNEVEKALDVRPVIYTNTPFGNQYLNHPEFANYALWIAEYGVREPRIPKTWTNKGWLIWQRTDRDKVEGMLSTCDQDTLKGNFRELMVVD